MKLLLWRSPMTSYLDKFQDQFLALILLNFRLLLSWNSLHLAYTTLPWFLSLMATPSQAPLLVPLTPPTSRRQSTLALRSWISSVLYGHLLTWVIISFSLKVLNIIYTSNIPTCISIQITPLNARFIYPTAYLTSPPGCLPRIWNFLSLNLFLL